jgi:NitT/TauT family transport system substrate-binding protein
MDTAPIGDLVRQARTGDARAWQSIAARLYPFALGIARRRLRGSGLAEDAVQEAFLAAFCALADLREPDFFPAWLAAIVRNQCTRLALGQRTDASLDDMEDGGLAPPGETADPAEGLHAARLRAAFDAALDALPGHLRQAARQHYGRGRTSAEIAASLGICEGTVKKRLHAAREILREKMLPFGGGGILRVGYMPITDHLLAMAALELYRDRPLPVAPRRYLSWQALTADLRRGRVDAAFIMAPLAMRLAASGTDLAHVMDAHHDGSSLAVSAEGPLRRLGLPAPYSTHQVLFDHLTPGRPELKDVSLTVISPSFAISSMRAKKIDAFFCAEPWGAKCVQEKLGRTVFFSKDILPGHTCCILAVRREFADRHGQVVREYVRRLLSARDRVRDDPGLGAGVLAACTGVPRDVAQTVLARRLVTFDDLRPRQERMEIFMPMMRREAGAVSRAAPFDLGRFVCPDYA